MVSVVCLVRVTHTQNPPRTEDISCTIFDLVFMADDDPENDKPVAGRLLDAQFYDDTQLVLVLQTTEETRKSDFHCYIISKDFHSAPISFSARLCGAPVPPNSHHRNLY